MSAGGRGGAALAIFCGLEEKWRAGFRPWLMEEMFPARLRIGFLACASYDAVPEVPETAITSAPPFLTLYEAPALADLYGPAYQGLRQNRSPRDRAYHGYMQNLERYTLAAAGVGAESEACAGLAPYLFADRFSLEASKAQEFLIWLTGDYAPRMAGLPGFVRLRLFLAVEGEPRHVLLHEFLSEAFARHPLWLAARREPAWEACMMAHGAPGLYRRVTEA